MLTQTNIKADNSSSIYYPPPSQIQWQLQKMEVDGDYPQEISSFHVSQARTRDLLSPVKKRKFLAETKEQHSLQVSKFMCRESLIERDPFSNQSLQDKVFYTHIREGKAPLQEVADYSTHNNQEESTQDSNSTNGDSQCSDNKSNVYHPKPSLYDESSSSSSHSGADGFCSMTSTMVDGFGPGDDEVEGDRFCEDKNVDEFGHCLEYLVSACDGEEETDEELQNCLYSNGMIPRSCLISPESLTAEASQINKGKATIDQEFEQYFSMLML